MDNKRRYVYKRNTTSFEDTETLLSIIYSNNGLTKKEIQRIFDMTTGKDKNNNSHIWDYVVFFNLIGKDYNSFRPDTNIYISENGKKIVESKFNKYVIAQVLINTKIFDKFQGEQSGYPILGIYYISKSRNKKIELLLSKLPSSFEEKDRLDYINMIQEFDKIPAYELKELISFEQDVKYFRSLCVNIGLLNNEYVPTPLFEEIIQEKIELQEVEDIISNNPHTDVSLITEVMQIVNSRRGQEKFRKLVIDTLEKPICQLCNISDGLIASHIKPWTISDNNERLDPNNGLLLCRNHDFLFDSFLISFDENGKILINENVDNDAFNIDSNYSINMSESKKEYMKYHRSKFLEKNRNLQK